MSMSESIGIASFCAVGVDVPVPVTESGSVNISSILAMVGEIEIMMMRKDKINSPWLEDRLRGRKHDDFHSPPYSQGDPQL